MKQPMCGAEVQLCLQYSTADWELLLRVDVLRDCMESTLRAENKEDER